jgi:hypothetical protein
MSTPTHDDTPDLELALLRRGMVERADGPERCDRCRRTPLIGERVYLYDGDRMLCELCRALHRTAPARSLLVHGPAFGHSIRITDRRAA